MKLDATNKEIQDLVTTIDKSITELDDDFMNFVKNSSLTGALKVKHKDTKSGMEFTLDLNIK